MNRINDKINEIEKYLEELSNIVPESFDDYLKDNKSKAACERYAEKIIEAVVDLAFLFIKFKKFKMPEDDEGTFDILKEENIIDTNLSKKLKEAKGMRNILAHEYGEVDNSIVYNAVKDELPNDVEGFIKTIRETL